MRRIVFVLTAAALLFGAPRAEAMEGIEITVSPGYTIPIWGYAGTARDETAGGLSFTVRGYLGSMMVGEYEFDYGFEAGYFPLYSWEYTWDYGIWGEETYKSSYSVMPFLGQVRYRFGEPGDDSYFYGMSGLGFYHWRWKYENSFPVYNYMTGQYVTEEDSGTATSTTLGLTAGVGYKAQLGDNLHGDVMLRWTGAYSVINLHFGLGMLF